MFKYHLTSISVIRNIEEVGGIPKCAADKHNRTSNEH